uniref:Uncharacterized protein n=1 Tax=uncultured Elusimicrobia bacterium TaxID=699876 RepID=A0A650EMD3_9BACT|nr:hypothetical protein Elusimicrob1349_0620 [uncultured Elusimicrobia bacterium]
MNGWQRFAILLLCCFAVMVLYPNFDASGWTFIGILIAMWTGGIMILSIVSNIFGIYRFETLNKLVSLVFLCAVMYTLLWYFPQEDKVTPINKLKYGEFPTKSDIDKGLKRFKFNFDFVRRNARRSENFINQDMDGEKVKKEIKKTVSKKTDELIDSLQIEAD